MTISLRMYYECTSWYFFIIDNTKKMLNLIIVLSST